MNDLEKKHSWFDPYRRWYGWVPMGLYMSLCTIIDACHRRVTWTMFAVNIVGVPIAWLFGSFVSFRVRAWWRNR